MTFRFSTLALTIVLFIGCKSTDLKMNFSNSSIVAFNLIRLCVDTTIHTNTLINTKNYVLDLSSISALNKTGVDSFLAIKNSQLPTTIDDSTIITPSNNFDDSYMKQSMIIKIKSIEAITEEKTTVTIRKFKSGKEKFDAIINLKRYLLGYEIIDFKIVN
jgi:hypothetical protein